jgi:hypothetical protein
MSTRSGAEIYTGTRLDCELVVATAGGLDILTETIMVVNPDRTHAGRIISPHLGLAAPMDLPHAQKCFVCRAVSGS